MSALQSDHARALARRDREIRRLRARGWKLAAIAERHGITRQRVHQIINRTEAA